MKRYVWDPLVRVLGSLGTLCGLVLDCDFDVVLIDNETSMMTSSVLNFYGFILEFFNGIIL